MKITDLEIMEADELIERQVNHSHPLMLKRQDQVNKAGQKNKKVMIAFKELRNQLKIN